MIVDEGHPRMQAAQALLERAMVQFRGRDLDGATLAHMLDVVRDHRDQCRREGIAFPALVPLVNTRRGVIEWVRQDLGRAAVRVAVRNFIIRNPDLTPGEIAQAVHRAWPGLPRGWLVDQARDGKARMQRSVVRTLSSTPTGDAEMVAEAIAREPVLQDTYRGEHR